jgi:hypothetical protein
MGVEHVSGLGEGIIEPFNNICGYRGCHIQMRIIKYFEKYFIWQHKIKLCEQLYASGTGEYIFIIIFYPIIV